MKVYLSMKKIACIIIALMAETSIYCSQTSTTILTKASNTLCVIRATHKPESSVDITINAQQNLHDCKKSLETMHDNLGNDDLLDIDIKIAHGILTHCCDQEIIIQDNAHDEAINLTLQGKQEKSHENLLYKAIDADDALQLSSLLDQNAHSNISDLLDRAMLNNNLPAFDILLTKIPSLNDHIDYGQTLMHKAIFRNHIACLSLLVSKGANVDATDSYGYTLLQSAVKNNNIAAATLLLIHGADTLMKDTFGSTVLDYEQTETMKNLVTTMSNAFLPKAYDRRPIVPTVAYVL